LIKGSFLPSKILNKQYAGEKVLLRGTSVGLWQRLWGSGAGLLLLVFSVVPALQWGRHFWCFLSSLRLELQKVFAASTLHVKKVRSAGTLRRWHWR